MSQGGSIIDRLASAASELQEASNASLQAEIREPMARREACIARSRLNEARRAFAALSAEARNGEPTLLV